MMTCDRVRELLPLLLYDDLPSAEAGEVRGHVQQCVSCQQELTALGGVRQALDSGMVPAVTVDLGRVYAQATQRQLRRWRGVAGLAAAVAALLLLVVGLQLEVRCEAHQLVVRWGAPPPVAVAPPAPAVAVPPPAVEAADIQLVKGLIQVLMTDMQDRDREQQRALARLQMHLEALQRQQQQRWVATERELTALYTAQFGTRGKGD
jgi:hypothetical protein